MDATGASGSEKRDIRITTNVYPYGGSVGEDEHRAEHVQIGPSPVLAAAPRARDGVPCGWVSRRTVQSRPVVAMCAFAGVQRPGLRAGMVRTWPSTRDGAAVAGGAQTIAPRVVGEEFLYESGHGAGSCQIDPKGAKRHHISYQGESWTLDSLEGVYPGQAQFEFPATSVLFSKNDQTAGRRPCRE